MMTYMLADSFPAPPASDAAIAPLTRITLAIIRSAVAAGATMPEATATAEALIAAMMREGK